MIVFKQKVDTPGIEPGAYCLQSRRDTTTPCTQLSINPSILLNRMEGKATI